MKENIDLSNIKIDKEEYEKQLKYFKTYYGDSFKHGQGTEQILEMIHKYSKDGNWIDFGSGSNVYFWASAFNSLDNINCVDISKEAFIINEEIRNGKFNSEAFKYVYNKYGKDVNKVNKLRINYNLLDFFNEEFKINKKFKNISQFGLLGLSKNKNEYRRHFTKLIDLIDEDGIILCANWKFSIIRQKELGFNNDYLNIDFIESLAIYNNLVLKEYGEFNIKNDEKYDKVIFYCMGKNAHNTT